MLKDLASTFFLIVITSFDLSSSYDFTSSAADENGLSQKENKTVDCQEFERRKLSEKSQNGRDKEMLAAKLDGEEIPRLRQHSPTMNTMQRYIEHKITDEGGTINLMGVCLSIPDEALSSDHVIAVTVIRDPGVLLPECVQGCRMTPLIKLEPKGLKLSKAGRLTIPFSTVIPESDCPSVMVFTGHERELVKGKDTLCVLATLIISAI